MTASGLHHVTLITRDVQANVDFYAGFLGLRLVKRTAGFEDAEQLHLFYGDETGSPGSLATFLVWQDGAAGRVGHGQVIEIAFSIPPDALGFWLTRAVAFGAPLVGPVREFGEPLLKLRDPDGATVRLVGVERADATPWTGSGIGAGEAIRGLRSVAVLSERPEETERFFETFGWRRTAREGGVARLVSDLGDVIDVRDGAGFWPGGPGAGVADHVALRVADRAALDEVETALRRDADATVTVHDRKYFASLYVREPGRTLVEFATDGPGFTVDEPPETLGSRLTIPPRDAARADEIALSLPDFALPGEPRMANRDLAFVHRLKQPDDPDGSALVLLHGTGGSETDLMPLGRRIAPRATLLGVRGRSTEEGVLRWFRRRSLTTFDQADVRFEAEAFAAFMEDVYAAYGLDRARTTFLGYSNGANLLAAAMLLHPGLGSRAILLRPMNVLEEPPTPTLEASVLALAGRTDPYGSYAPELAALLSRAGAEVELQAVAAGHELVEADVALSTRWLSAGRAADAT